MATFKQAQRWMKEGEKVFIPSEKHHIYCIEKGKLICSCGAKVEWFEPYKKRKDWKRVHIKGINVKKLRLKDVGVYMDEEN